MQLVHALAAGVRGAENGAAYIYNRGGSAQVAYYLGDGGFEGTNQVAAGTTVDLDENGGASVYVSQLCRVVVKDVDGITVRTFTVGEYDANVEVISPSFTGTDYDTAVSAANKPTTLENVLDGVITSFGTTDWNVLVGGSSVTIQAAVAALGGYLISVKDTTYGAIGDGATDDTLAIQAALDAAATLGKVVLFPKGTYRVTADLDWPATVNLLGIEGHSILQIDHATEIPVISTDDGTTRKWCQGMTFSAAQTNTTGIFVQVLGNSFVGFSRCHFNGLLLDPNTAVGMIAVGEAAHVSDVLIHACRFIVSSDLGAVVSRITNTTRIEMSDCNIEVTSTQPALATRSFVGGSTIIISNCYFNMAAANSPDSWTILDPVDLCVATGNTVTTPVTGSVTFVTTTVGSDEVFESANRLPPDSSIVSATSSLVQGSLNSRREKEVDSSNDAAIVCDFINNKVFELLTTNDTAKTLTAPGLCEGLTAIFYIRKSGGATETLTFGTGFSMRYNGAIASGDEIMILMACFDDGLGGGLEWHQIGDATEF